MTDTQNARPRAKRVAPSVRRAQLLAAAHHVFVEHGYHGSSMDQIAELAEVSKPVVYQHFSSKDELYGALLDHHLQNLTAQLRASLESTVDNRDRVQKAIGVFFTFTESERRAYKLIFESDVISVPAISERLERFNSNLASRIAHFVAEDTGLAQSEAELLGRALIGSAQVAARAWVRQDESERVSLECASQLIADLAWRGISRFPKEGQ